MAYTNFAIEVTALPNNRFRIAIRSDVGEASAEVSSPFTPADRARYQAVLGRKSKVSRTEEIQFAQDFGRRIFEFLINNNRDINAAYFASMRQNNTEGLRIQLSVDDAGDLAHLPWELLHDPRREFLALSRMTPVVRYTQLLTTRPPIPVSMPLRVLVMISSPSDDFPELDVEDEWNRLQEATKSLRESGRIQFDRLDEATLIALQRRLRAEDYHVFHYIGHSTYDQNNQQGVLALENEDNNKKVRLVSGAALSREIGEESTIRLVILNSCQSARSDETNPFSGIASSIVTRGIPAVVAMQYPISDNAAKAFSEEFYRATAEGLPIDSAISEARRAIANRIHNTEWVTPVLYLRSSSGALFTPTSRLQTGREPEPQPTRRFDMRLIIGAIVLLIVGAGLLALLLGGNPVEPPATPTIEASETPIITELPNLEIVSIRTAPAQPAPGQTFRLLVSVRNSGEVSSPPFNWTWDADATTLNALEGRIETIPPGATKSFSLAYSYGWWGTYDSLINIDIDGEVQEEDERDNRLSQTIILDDDAPFDIDFSFLPDNSIVEPPLVLADNTYQPWNLAFEVGTTGESGCDDAPLTIVDNETALVLTTNGETAPSACADNPMVITLRRAVSNARVEIVSEADGQATLRLFSDPVGIRTIYEETIPVTAGERVLLGTESPLPDAVLRVVVELAEQPVYVDRLIFFRES